MHTETLIVGAGLAGLFMARELLKKRPGSKVMIFEKYKQVGGRVLTHYKDGHQWEIGAGRISSQHTKVLQLIKDYNLQTLPIGPEILYREDGDAPFEKNAFEDAINVLLKPLAALAPSVLGNHTLKELLTEVHGAAAVKEWMNRFPYHSEMVTLRADMALLSFLGEMKTHEGYFVCKEGLSAIANEMAAEILKRGGEFYLDQELVRVKKGEATFHSGVKVTAERIILAMPISALKKLERFQGWSVGGHLTMKPLMRIYAVFPLKEGKAWFHGLPRVVTTNPIRYFLPTSEEHGEAMVSYTDAIFTKPYLDAKKEGPKALEKAVMDDLRRLFPERAIPNPTFLRAYPWDNGVSYWLPGAYSPSVDSEKALNPFPGIYLCNESFSLRQGWMEGALEHATLLLEHINR
jgi:monoamine oxidase